MKTCEKCGTVNEADVNFCVNCGNKLSNNVDAAKNHAHMDMPSKKSPAVAEQKENGKQFCEQCGTANESDVKFCVSCGNNMSGNSSMPSRQEYPSMPYQNRPVAKDQYMSDEEMMQLRSVPNPLMIIWEKFLFPEKMIVIGAILNFLLAIFWVSVGYMSVSMAFLYFATMGASLFLINLSREVTLLKKIELSRWQIVIGASWLAWLISPMLSAMFGSYGYGNMSISSTYAFFGTIFSILMLSGAIMLQGLLVQHAFQQKNK